MALNKNSLKKDLYDGLKSLFLSQNDNSAKESDDESPEDVIENLSDKMASVISDAVDKYVKSGDITVDATVVAVTSAVPGSAAAVSPLNPAKMI